MLVSMKKATLFALKPDKEAILLALQKCGEFMVIPPENAGAPEDTGLQVQQTMSAIKFVDTYGKKASFLSARPMVSYDEFIQDKPEARELCKEAQEAEKQLAAVKGEAAAKRALVAQLIPWAPLEVPIDAIKPTKYARFFAGYIDPQREGELQSESLSEADIQLLGAGPEGRAVFVACHTACAQQIQSALNEAGFVEAALPRVAGTARAAIDQLERQAGELDQKAQEIEGRAAELAQRSGELKELYDALKAESERKNAQVANTAATFCIQGWVPENKQDAIEKAVACVTENYDLSFENPAEGEIPPTYTKNSKVVTPFESITELYSLPAYGSFDPNSIMAPFYTLFFGMMMGDAGYGLVLALALLFYMKAVRPKGGMKQLMSVMLIGGVATIFCGFFFGSAFGAELPGGVLYPMKNTMELLLLSAGLGVVQLFAGLIIKACMDIKNGDVIGAIADNLSWVAIITGLLLLFLEPVRMVGIVLAAAGALLILLFAGRDKKNPISRLISGLSGLYNVTSYMSDIISYTRIAALGMSSGVIASVINTLALMVKGDGGVGWVFMILVLVIGHTFNLAIGLLGAFVHSSRLQFVEFYGKFYETGGRAFVPLAFKTKYVDVAANTASKAKA